MPESSKESTNAVFTKLDKQKLLKQWEFSEKNIKKVLANKEQFEKIQLYREALINHGFNNNQIIKATCLPVINIDYLIEHFQFLNKFTDSIENIISIVGQRGGKSKISHLLEHSEAIIKLGFRKLIWKIISHKSAVRSIEKIVTYNATDTYQFIKSTQEKPELLKSLKISLKDFQFTVEEMTKILAHESGASNFDSLLEYYVPLRNLGFSRINIIQLAGKRSVRSKLRHLLDNARYFFEYGCSIEDIIKLYNPTNGVEIAKLKLQQLENGQALENTIQTNSQLRMLNHKNIQVKKSDRNLVINECGFSEEELTSILRKPSGIETFAFLKKHCKKLMNLLDNNTAALYRIANHKSGHVTLQAFIDNYPILIDHFTLEQIVSLASCSGGKNNLESIEENLQVLTANDFILSKEEIIFIASCQGGGLKIKDLVANIDNLIKYKTKEEIYNYYKKVGYKRAHLFLEGFLEEINQSQTVNSTEIKISDMKPNNINISSASLGMFRQKKRKLEEDEESTETQSFKYKKTHKIPGIFDKKNIDSETEDSYYPDLDIPIQQSESSANVVTPDIVGSSDIKISDDWDLKDLEEFDNVFY